MIQNAGSHTRHLLPLMDCIDSESKIVTMEAVTTDIRPCTAARGMQPHAVLSSQASCHTGRSRPKAGYKCLMSRAASHKAAMIIPCNASESMQPHAALSRLAGSC